jgi:hypothetical protein
VSTRAEGRRRGEVQGEERRKERRGERIGEVREYLRVAPKRKPARCPCPPLATSDARRAAARGLNTCTPHRGRLDEIDGKIDTGYE